MLVLTVRSSLPLRLHGLCSYSALGNVLMMIDMSRLRTTWLLYGSGIPIIGALEMVSGIVQNLVVREAVLRSVEGVRRGALLTSALGESDLMPTLVMRMISLGERAGSLEHSLNHVASYYDREVPGIIDRALALFNTALIASLGIMLGSIALGIFVPLYQMMGNLNAEP